MGNELKEREETSIAKAGSPRLKEGIIWGLVLVFLVCGVALFKAKGWIPQVPQQMTKTQMHISMAVTTARNCNDCHLGKDFINLFSNQIVKDNEALSLKMMTDAGIKKW